MQLFFSPTSPYVRKCLVAAHELGLDSRIQFLPSAAHPVQRDASIVARNPLGKVPTLIADDGMVLYDSRVICEYLDSLAGGGRLFPAAGAARWRALALQALADGLLDAALLARYETAVRPEALRWADWTAGQMDKIVCAMNSLDSGATPLHDGVDIGTISAACALGYLDLRYADLGWRARWPRVAAWAAVFGQRESMQRQWSM